MGKLAAFFTMEEYTIFLTQADIQNFPRNLRIFVGLFREIENTTTGIIPELVSGSVVLCGSGSPTGMSFVCDAWPCTLASRDVS